MDFHRHFQLPASCFPIPAHQPAGERGRLVGGEGEEGAPGLMALVINSRLPQGSSQPPFSTSFLHLHHMILRKQLTFCLLYSLMLVNVFHMQVRADIYSKSCGASPSSCRVGTIIIKTQVGWFGAESPSSHMQDVPFSEQDKFQIQLLEMETPHCHPSRQPPKRSLGFRKCGPGSEPSSPSYPAALRRQRQVEWQRPWVGAGLQHHAASVLFG